MAYLYWDAMPFSLAHANTSEEPAASIFRRTTSKMEPASSSKIDILSRLPLLHENYVKDGASKLLQDK